jgi:hypothetical protein
MTPTTPPRDADLGPRELGDFYMKMYLENLTFARHHESQRSSATTMFFGLPVAILTIGVALWRDGISLLLGSGLMLVALGGIALSLKLFERSAFHMMIANAYRDLLEELYRDAAHAALPPDRLKRTNFVQGAFREQWGFVRAGLNYREKKIVRFVEDGPDNEDEGVRSLQALNPAAPFKWVDPIHNRFARYVGQEAARWDLYRIWAWLLAAVGLVGLLALGALLFLSWDSLTAVVARTFSAGR